MSKSIKILSAIFLSVLFLTSCSEAEDVAPPITEYGSWNITSLTFLFDDERIQTTNRSLLEDEIVIKRITFNENGTATLQRSLNGDLLNATYTLDDDTGLLNITSNGINYQYTMTLTEDRFTLNSVKFKRGGGDESGEFTEQKGDILFASVFALFDQGDALDAALDKDPAFISAESSFINVNAIDY